MNRTRIYAAAVIALIALAAAAVVGFQVRPDAAQTCDYVIDSVTVEDGAIRILGSMTAGDAVVTGVLDSQAFWVEPLMLMFR